MGAAFVVLFDRADHIAVGNHGHAAGQSGFLPQCDGVEAEALIAVGVAIADGNGAGFPTAALVAAP